MTDSKVLKEPGVEEAEIPSSSEGETMVETLSPKELNQPYSREYIVNYGDFPWRDMELLHGSTPAYWAENSEITRKKPDITLRGGGKDGPVVGFSRYRFSRSLTCGVGSDDISADWIKMERAGMFKCAFKFEWREKHYTLRHAKTADYGGKGMQRLLWSHFKVVDDASGKLIALYVSEAGVGRKKGTLKIASGVGPKLEIFIVLGITSVRDKQARRAKYASGGGGGGGGG